LQRTAAVAEQPVQPASLDAGFATAQYVRDQETLSGVRAALLQRAQEAAATRDDNGLASALATELTKNAAKLYDAGGGKTVGSPDSLISLLA
jgi:hypothetical protein